MVLKLPAHPVRTGQARRGFPGTQWRTECEPMKFHSDCAPSCLPVGRDPAYPARAGRGTCRSRRLVEKLFPFQDEIDDQFIGQMVEVLPQTLF
jgi:hypothetical protein